MPDHGRWTVLDGMALGVPCGISLGIALQWQALAFCGLLTVVTRTP